MKKPFNFLVLVLASIFCQVGAAYAQIEIREDDNVAQVQQPQLKADTETATIQPESVPTVEAQKQPTSRRVKAYTRKQIENMKLAHEIGEEIGHGPTMQAILLQETRAGEGGSIGGLKSAYKYRSYGIMQVQPVAARSVFQRYPDVFEKYFDDDRYRKKAVTDKQIIDLLLTNHEASVRIATYNFHLMMKLTKGSWHRSVAAYNAGIGNALRMREPSKFGYVREIAQKVHTVVKPFNKEIGL